MNRYNMVIVGKTGVGKSTLLNYLYGNAIREAGAGKPVTKVGFHPVDFHIGDLPVRVFDSWGLEADKADQWMQTLEKELNNRGVDKSADQWFHTILYCIQAGGARVEDFEIMILKMFLEEKYKVTVILTKADQATEAELESLCNVIQNEFIGKVDVIKVCSEEKVLLGGITTKKFGKEIMEKRAYSDFWNSLCERLPYRCESILLNYLNEWKKNQYEYIDNQVGYFNGPDCAKTLICQCDCFISKLNREANIIVFDEILSAFKMYDNFAKNLNYPPVSISNSLTVNIRSCFPTADNWDSQAIDRFFNFPIIFIPLMLWMVKSINKKSLKLELGEACIKIETEIKRYTNIIQFQLNKLKSEYINREFSGDNELVLC